MGTLRKMGAFLGLVPDEARQYGEHDYDADNGYDAEYSSGSYANDERSTEYGTPYVGDSYDTADERVGSDRAGYSEPGYGADDRGVEYTSDPAYAPAGGYADDLDPADQPTREYAYAGAEPAMQPTARSSASRGRGRNPGGGDYQTHGALAVQAQPRMESVATDPGGAAKPVTVKLEGFADARQVGETYRDGVAVILDMTDLTDPEARRMVDFAAGLAFAVRGSIDKVTTKVFMLHPPTADTDR